MPHHTMAFSHCTKEKSLISLYLGMSTKPLKKFGVEYQNLIPHL